MQYLRFAMTLVGLLNALIRIFGDPYLRFKVKQIFLRRSQRLPGTAVDSSFLRNTTEDNIRDDTVSEQSMHAIEESKIEDNNNNKGAPPTTLADLIAGG